MWWFLKWLVYVSSWGCLFNVLIDGCIVMNAFLSKFTTTASFQKLNLEKWAQPLGDLNFQSMLKWEYATVLGFETLHLKFGKFKLWELAVDEGSAGFACRCAASSSAVAGQQLDAEACVTKRAKPKNTWVLLVDIKAGRHFI